MNLPTADDRNSPPSASAAALSIAVIEGSSGYRRVLTSYIQTAWPDAKIEAIDPYSQTMRGAGIVFGTQCDVMVLGGIGTRAEAMSALARLRANAQSADTTPEAQPTTPPPLILLVSPELASQAEQLRAAGAAAVLHKDALSRQSLIDAIATATRTAQAPSTGAGADFGKFTFAVDGEQVALAIERFACVKTLASNAMSQVFLAERLADGKRVVIKVPVANPYHDATGVQRFCDRYQFIQGLDGDGVVRYVDVGIAGSWPYVVLEHLSAGDLRQRMAAGLTTAQALTIIERLAISLATFHGGQFAHMDVKPENIFFRDDDVVLIDFNISTRFGNVARNRETQEVLGSPFYMSPEQGQGLPADHRSDLYSAGVILYEMLTGNRPYAGDNSAQVIYKHLHEEIPLLPKRIRDLQPLIDHLLAKSPDERYGTASAFALALRPWLAKYAGDSSDSAPVKSTY
ncbi:MAG: serine/threonine protein kinase [Betaproteobacteria bacterium]|nr:serine/threonine protein kinase [Betaproteobacteria bacterium]